MSRKALIVHGGWEGHQPQQVADVFAAALREENFEVAVADSLDALVTHDLAALALIVPVWTMGKIAGDQLKPVLDAVRHGVGLAGCHGGMCDAFRDATEWQFMTGGQWVAHPGDDTVHYTVRIRRDTPSPITEGVEDFEVTSEQYYMHVDPAVRVLATTRFPVADGPHVMNGMVDMPVLWTKWYGAGRVFYSSIGHTAAVTASEPHLTMVRRGFAWAARQTVQSPA